VNEQSLANVVVAAEMHATHPAGLVEMSKGPFQSLAAEPQQAQATCPPNASTIAVHRVARRRVLRPVPSAAIGLGDVTPDAHGFEILKRLESAGSGALKLKEGSLYPALYRLEKSGLVKAEWESNATPRRGPRRRVYRLTPKGRKRLDVARDEFQHFTSIIGSILGASA